MASSHIQALLGPPSIADAEKRTLDFLSTRFKTYQDFEHAEELDDLVKESRRRKQELETKVRVCVRYPYQSSLMQLS